MATFEIDKYDSVTDGSPYYWRLKASNGRILCRSSYRHGSASACETEIAIVKQLSFTHRVQWSKDRKWYFELFRADGRGLAYSETYETEAGANHGVSVVRAEAPTAPVRNVARV